MPGIPVFNLAGTAVASTTTATIAWPTHATNHVALLLIQTDAESSSLVTAAGFVAVSNAAQSTGTAAAVSAVALQVYWKRATSTAEANVTCADAGDHVYARIITFTNVVTSGNPWDVTAGGVKAASSTNCQITGATTTTANCLIVAIAANGTDTATSQASTWTNANLANPAMAEVADSNTTTGNGGGLSVGTGGLAVAGTIGTTTVTLATAGKNAFVMIALKQDPNVTGTGSMAVPVPAMSGRAPNFSEVRQAIITGLDSAQSEAHGWDAEVKAKIAVTDVVRTSDTVVTITLDAEAAYDITAQETITATVPGQSIVSGVPLVATPTFTVDTTSITGTGSMAVPIPSLAGSGIRGLLGIGAMAVVLALSGTGQQTESGTGSMAVPVPTMAGTGQQTHTGTGSLAVAPSLSGTGQQTHTGTGSIAVAVPTLNGSGTVSGAGTTGSGSMAVAPTIAGTGQQTEGGSGSLAVPIPSLSGTGIAGIIGSGSLAVPLPVYAFGDTIAYQVPQMSGTGTVSNPITGTGSLAVAVPTLAGTGKQTESGTGSLAVAPTMAGTGTSGSSVTGTGSLALSVPSLAGTGQQTETGTGSLAVPIPSLSGTGKQTHTGTGSLSVAPVLSGAGFTFVPTTGTGSLAVAPSLSGSGIVGNIGSGSLSVLLTLDGSGTTLAANDASLGKYKPEHDSALALIAAFMGSPEVQDTATYVHDHAQALSMISESGT